MLKTLTATLAVALIAATAGQAFALNPQPLPPRQMPHIVIRCPPSSNPYVRTCV